MATGHVHDESETGDHTHTPSQSHSHTHTQTKAVVNRLSRAIGHLESVKRMVQEGRDCSEVLIQLAAVRAALNNTAQIILKDHVAHCLVDAVEKDDASTLENLNKAIEHFMK
jgi:DNA-binding FrmR family transcriptional regulator